MESSLLKLKNFLRACGGWEWDIHSYTIIVFLDYSSVLFAFQIVGDLYYVKFPLSTSMILTRF